MISITEIVIICISIFLIGFFAGKGLHEFLVYKKHKKAEDLIKEASDEAKSIIQNAENKSSQIIQNAQAEAEKRIKSAEKLEEKILQKEEKLEIKLETLEKEKEKVLALQQEVQDVLSKQKETLAKIAGLNPQEAKKILFDTIEQENKAEIISFVNKFKEIKQEEAKKEAYNIIAHALPRIGMSDLSEFTVTTVNIESEETKGKIIGREGRNISYFEKITGVELLIDDTPMVVRLSSFDPEKRFIATQTLEKLLKDGRINPFYIEKYYKEVSLSLPDYMLEKGKEALTTLNIPMMKPEIVKMIGQFFLRYSYGQNLFYHSIEVAKISEIIANEMGFDGQLAKKAGLLHDIGKIVVGTTGEAHAKAGADLLRQYGFDAVVVNAAESHHFDVPFISPISAIVTAADAISAGRPGARFNSKEFFVERMANLEKLILSVDGVEKTFIMQAGREIMVFVNPSQVDDLKLENLVKEVGQKIESQLDYPGAIRIMAVRESKVVTYLR